jgi:hypothetical protein
MAIARGRSQVQIWHKNPAGAAFGMQTTLALPPAAGAGRFLDTRLYADIYILICETGDQIRITTSSPS